VLKQKQTKQKGVGYIRGKTKGDAAFFAADFKNKI